MPHRISGFTPFKLQYGKQTHTILSTFKFHWLGPEDTPINITDFMLDFQKYINTVMEAVQFRLQDFHVKVREKSYHVKLRVLNVGDIVLWKTSRLSKSQSTG